MLEFVSAMIFFGCNLSNVNPLKCVSMNNQECKVRPEIININSNELSFYLYSVKINKGSGSLIILMIHIQKVVFLMLLKINLEVFNLMSRTNKTTYIKLYETCKCRLDASICNNKQR